MDSAGTETARNPFSAAAQGCVAERQRVEAFCWASSAPAMHQNGAKVLMRLSCASSSMTWRAAAVPSFQGLVCDGSNAGSNASPPLRAVSCDRLYRSRP